MIFSLNKLDTVINSEGQLLLGIQNTLYIT